MKWKEEPGRASSLDEDRDLEGVIRKVIGRYLGGASEREQPRAKGHLQEERRRREEAERQLAEATEENRRVREQAERAERYSSIRNELRALGVHKTDLAFRLVKDDIFRAEDGGLHGDVGGKRMSYQDYLSHFIADNPEFLPPRIPGGSGAVSAERNEMTAAGFDLNRIRPGMSKEELAQAWKEVARLAGEGSNR